MEHKFRKNYEVMTDRQIVELVTNPAQEATPNDEGVAYLLLVRYQSVLKSLYFQLFYNTKVDYFDDCVDDLFEHLRSGDPTWVKLKNFEWRSELKTWLTTIALHRFQEYKKKLVNQFDARYNVDEPSNSKMLADDSHEKDMTRILVIEAISKLGNEDQKFVLIKRLEGYNSEEIADLLAQAWENKGIVKYNRAGNLIIPTPAYINSCTQHAKANLKKLLES